VKKVRSRLRDEHADATRAALLSCARGLFSVQGYAATSLDQIALEARVTKGAVYHHFSGKLELFRDVYEALALELKGRLADCIARTPDPAAKAMAAISLLFESADERDVCNILFRDGPAVLRDECREIDERQFLGLVHQVLDELAQRQLLVGMDTSILSRLLLSVLIESSMLLGRSKEVKKTRAALRVALTRILSGLISAPGARMRGDKS
jgi:AcrR family transcriptional regulator